MNRVSALLAPSGMRCESCENSPAVLEVGDIDGASFMVCGNCAPVVLLPGQRHG